MGQHLEGSHRWCRLGAAGVPGTDAKIALGGWAGSVWVVGAFGDVFGEKQGSDRA